MLRHTPVLLVLLAVPAAAQDVGFDLGLGNGSGGSSSVTIQVQQTPPHFTGDFTGANVLSGVNVRQAPSSKAAILGTLSPGGTVLARCSRGWCELQDGGYVGQKFLSFDASGSFDLSPPMATEANLDTTTSVAPPATLDATLAPNGSDSTATLGPPTSPDSVPANFGGSWIVTSDPTQANVPLTLVQTGTAVTGTLQGANRVTKLSGDVQGTRLTFTYQMADAKGRSVAAGNGYLTLATGGQSLSGVLMLNGLVVANLNAKR
jgi:hypothetical protein